MGKCCLFGLVGDKIKADMLFGVKENKDSAILLSSQVLPLHILLSPLLIPLPCLLPLHFLLSHLLSHPDLTPLLVSHLLSFGLLSIPPPHPSQFLISLLNSSTCPSSHLLLTFSIPLLTSHYILATFGHLLPPIYFILTFPVVSPLPLFLHIVSSPLLIY